MSSYAGISLPIRGLRFSIMTATMAVAALAVVVVASMAVLQGVRLGLLVVLLVHMAVPDLSGLGKQDPILINIHNDDAACEVIYAIIDAEHIFSELVAPFSYRTCIISVEVQRSTDDRVWAG